MWSILHYFSSGVIAFMKYFEFSVNSLSDQLWNFCYNFHPHNTHPEIYEKFRLHFLITAQIAQVAQPVLFKWAQATWAIWAATKKCTLNHDFIAFVNFPV